MAKQSPLIDMFQILSRLTGDPVHAPLSFAPHSSRESREATFVAVPRLTDRAGEDSEVLEWTVSSQDPLIPAGWWLDEFVRLATADVTEIRTFAKRHGPLGSVAQPGEDAPRLEISESLDLWRAHAHSLRTLLRLLLHVNAGVWGNLTLWCEAMLAPVTPLLVAGESNGVLEARGFPDPGATIYGLLLAGEFPTQQIHQHALLSAISNALLKAVGVRADAGIGRKSTTGLSYALPIRTDRQPSTEEEEQRWIVDGLLPLLCVQTVTAMRTNAIKPCSGCGLPIPIAPDAPSPKTGVPFYGNHTECRLEARRRSKRESRRRRYRELKMERK